MLSIVGDDDVNDDDCIIMMMMMMIARFHCGKKNREIRRFNKEVVLN